MLKNNHKFKLKIKNTNNPGAPLPNNNNPVFNLNSCPIQNNKLNFNYIFWKETKNQNHNPFPFNNNLLNENAGNEIQKNSPNPSGDFKENFSSEINNINIMKNIQKTEEKPKRIKPLFQNILGQKLEAINRCFPGIHKNLNSNISPIPEDNNNNNNNDKNIRTKSNNILPKVKKGHKIIQNKSKPKHLFHNKSGNNIKINIDCALKNKFDENSQNKNKNLNNILIKKIPKSNNDKEIINYSENNVIRIQNIPPKKSLKLLEYFFKEEPNLNHKKSMEDFILIKNSFLNIEKHNLSLFGLFDGHGGSYVAEYLKNNFCEILTKLLLDNEDLNFIQILKIAFETVDKNLKQLNNTKECGSTGTIVIIDNDIIYCANVGDSKCYYINDTEAVQLTENHNCKNKIEVETIKNRGGKVFNGRVFGCLSLTRAFGDTDFKEFGINCEPYIKKISINKYNIKYIVIASDGIWDIVDDKQLLIIEKGLKKENSEEFCNNLVTYSLEGGSSDNISCIVLKFGE